MNRFTTAPMAAFACLLLGSGTLVGCTKTGSAGPADSALSETTADRIPTDTKEASTAITQHNAGIPYSVSVTYDRRPNGPYGYLEALKDYTFLSFWNGDCSRIVSGLLRVTLLKNKLGPEGGTVALINVPDAAGYQMSFQVKFSNGLDFSAGGKVGFGLLIGDGYSGGEPAWGGNGGSARVMWTRTEDGRIVLKPYLYHRDQPTLFGDDLRKTFPATGSIIKERWYTVSMLVKSNTGPYPNGRFRMTVNDTVVVDKAMRWTTNDLKRLINQISFETFRGGTESYWVSPYDGNIFFNNIFWTRL